MLTKRHILFAILATTLSVGAAAPVFAQGYTQGPAQTYAHTAPGRIILEAQRSVSPAEAKSIARSRVKGGEVVDISRRGDTYRVRVIAKNGKVVDVYIDANTGRVKK